MDNLPDAVLHRILQCPGVRSWTSTQCAARLVNKQFARLGVQCLPAFRRPELFDTTPPVLGLDTLLQKLAQASEGSAQDVWMIVLAIQLDMNLQLNVVRNALQTACKDPLNMNFAMYCSNDPDLAVSLAPWLNHIRILDIGYLDTPQWQQLNTTRFSDHYKDLRVLKLGSFKRLTYRIQTRKPFELTSKHCGHVEQTCARVWTVADHAPEPMSHSWASLVVFSLQIMPTPRGDFSHWFPVLKALLVLDDSTFLQDVWRGAHTPPQSLSVLAAKQYSGAPIPSDPPARMYANVHTLYLLETGTRFSTRFPSHVPWHHLLKKQACVLDRYSSAEADFNGLNILPGLEKKTKPN